MLHLGLALKVAGAWLIHWAAAPALRSMPAVSAMRQCADACNGRVQQLGASPQMRTHNRAAVPSGAAKQGIPAPGSIQSISTE